MPLRMPGRIHWGNLRTRIILWSFVPALIILSVVTVVMILYLHQSTEESAMRRNLSLTYLSAQRLATRLRDHGNVLSDLADSPYIQNKNPSVRRLALERAQESTLSFDAGVLLLDSSGEVVAAEPKRQEILGQNRSDRSYYQMVVQSLIFKANPEMVISDIVADGPGDTQVIACAVPILSDRGDFLGVLVGMFHLGTIGVDDLYGDLRITSSGNVTYSKGPPEGEDSGAVLRISDESTIYLVDGKGRVVYYPDSKEIGQDISGQSVVPRLLRGESGAIHTKDPAGQDIIVGYAPVPGTTWGLVVEENFARAISDQLFFQILLLIGLVLAIIIPSSVVATFGFSKIARPIIELTDAAKDVARGKFGQIATTSSVDEVRELARQFNIMSRQLKASYAHLEQRVASRTRELATLNAIASVVSRSLDLEEVLSSALEETMKILNVDAGGLLIVEPGEEHMKLWVQQGFSEELVQAMQSIPLNEVVADQEMALGGPVVLEVRDEPGGSVAPLMAKEGLQTMISALISCKNRPLGVMNLATKKQRTFPLQEKELLLAIGQQIGVALENVRLYEQAQKELAERRRAEAALRESEERYRQLFNRLPIGIFRSTPGGAVTEANPAALEILGFDSLEALNRFGMRNLYTDQAARDDLLEMLKQGPVSEFETRYRRADGRIIYVSIRASLSFDEEGNPEYMEGTFRDITQRRHAIQALRESEERLTLAIEGADLGLWDVNLADDTSFLYYDGLRWPSQERHSPGTSYNSLLQVIHPEDRAKVEEVFRRHLAGESDFCEIEIRSNAKYGEWILLRGQVVARDEQGQPLRMAGISQNVTARRQAEEELRKAKEAAETANRAKSTFLANMSHELRTPLNAIMGFSELMSRDVGLTTDQRENLEIIRRSGMHLLSLINDVLEMSKIEAGQTRLYEQSFDLHRLLDDLENMFSLRATDKGLQLIFDREPGLPQYVRADDSKLRQVLVNLISNGVKFTKEGGVTLRAGFSPAAGGAGKVREGRLQFEVEDTGPGIAPGDMEVIFNPFEQAASGRQSQEGTGLGLSISRQFVRLLSGEISVNSVVDQGSIFRFDLPVDLAEADEIQIERPRRRVIGLEPGQPVYRLLIAEDKDTNRKLLIKLLVPLGFEVREAINGQEAIEIWKSWEPHLIWMDMRMPVMDGHEATRQIKATTKGQATVVIALTASAFEEERKMILSEGCDDFVRKPFQEAEIFDRLSKHLGVRFVYEEEAARPASDHAVEAQGLLTPENLASAMSAETLAELHRAAISADSDHILDLLDRVRRRNAPLADALSGLANNFRFDTIAALTERAGA